MKAIKCGQLIDGISDEPTQDAVVLVEDGTIRDVGPREDITIPDDVRVVDHSSQVILPGLIDAHVHIYGYRQEDPTDRVVESLPLTTARAVSDLRELLQVGFTAIRDVGSKTGPGLKEAVSEGSIPGPRVYTSGLAMSQIAGHGDIHKLPHNWIQEHGGTHAGLADGESECRRESRKRIRNGVDLLKIQTSGGIMSEVDESSETQYSPEEIEVIAEEAHRVGIPLAAHAQNSASIELALENGVDTIEHGIYIDDETVDLMREHNAILVPTLLAVRRLAELGREYGYPDYGVRKAREAAEAHIESVKRAYEKGIPIAFGTDSTGIEPLQHDGSSIEEARLYVEDIGMSNMDVIKSLTVNAAKAIGDDSIGMIERGKRADMVVTDETPLRDIEALEDVDTVYKDGSRVNPV